MAVQINVAANQAALTASIQAGVQAYNQKFAQNNQVNLSVNQRAFSQPLGRMTGDVKDFEAALAASNARVIAFGASTAVLGGVIRSFKELANVTIDVEKNLADINRVFGLTTGQLQKFSTDLFSVGKQTASTFDDASKAALEFSRQGLKAEEVLIRTKDALTLARVAGISTANSVDALTSTINGFAATGVTTTQILNKLVAVEQDFAVGAGDLAEALSRTGQAAQEAGVSLDQLNALVTAAQQSTARGGAVIGNALKTIFTRLQRTETLDQLEAFNIAVRDVQGNTLPAVTVLQNFAGAYKNLGDAQRAQLSEQVAGVYQVNILKAIVGDLNKSQGVYAGALQRGASATNEAEVATAKLNQTLDALLKQTATSTQQLANNIGKVTFEPLARYGTEQLKSLVESMNEILEGEGVGSTFANGLLKGIRNVIAGPGAIAAFFTLFKLIQNSFTYLAQALPQIAGITTETQNRKNIEQSILQIMQQQGPVSQALAGSMGNQAAQAQLLLQLARQQTAEYQIQSTLAKQLATQLAGQGVRVKGSGGLQVTRAGGYIPNATRMAEAVGAQAGGYAPGKVVKSPVGGVMNTAEDVKYVPGFAQPFINPPAGSKAGRAHRQNAISRTGVDPYMNDGFIPNFANKQFIDDKGEVIKGKKPNKTRESYTVRLTDYNPINLKADEDLDLKRNLVDSGYYNDNVTDPKTNRIIHYHGERNKIYDKLSGNLKVIKYLEKNKVDEATKIAWDGLISGDTKWTTDLNITKLGMDEASVEAAYLRTSQKLGLTGEDFKFKKRASEDESVAASNTKYKSIRNKKLYKTSEEFKKSLNGDYSNFIGDFYEQLVLKHENVSGAYQISPGNTDPADLVPKILGSTMYKGIEAKNTAARINDLIAKSIRINVSKMDANTWDKQNDVDFGTLPIYQTIGRTTSYGGFIPNFSPLIDDNARNKHDFPKGIASLPIPDKAIQNILDRQQKRQMTYLDFDRTLVRTTGDSAYGRVAPEQKKGVLQKMFLNKEARLKDVKESRLTQFGELLRQKIQQKIIDPSLLGLMTASDETPGMPEYISSIWGIQKRNQVYSAKPGTKETRLASLGISSNGFIPNFAPPISMLRIPWFKKYANPSFDAKQPTLNIAGAGAADTFRSTQFRTNKTDYNKKAGDGNVFGPIYEKFVRSSIGLQANKSKIKSLILGQSLEPDTIQGESSFDSFMELVNTNPTDLLDLVGIEIKGGPKDSQTGGSATGIITKKYNNFTTKNPKAAARLRELLGVFNEPGNPQHLQYMSALGKEFLPLAATNYDEIAKNSPELLKVLSQKTNELLTSYVNNPSFYRAEASGGFIPNFASMISSFIKGKGNISAIKTGKNNYEIEGVEVGKKFRGQGLGSQLYGSIAEKIGSGSTIKSVLLPQEQALADYASGKSIPAKAIFPQLSWAKMAKSSKLLINGKEIAMSDFENGIAGHKYNAAKLDMALIELVNSHASGFIPNFAYKQAVMGLEESMSGEKAVFDTKPFPHIRNKSQPTFSSAIADHGGLGNALSDSMRGQKDAGLMNKGYVPNFAAPQNNKGFDVVRFSSLISKSVDDFGKKLSFKIGTVKENILLSLSLMNRNFDPQKIERIAESTAKKIVSSMSKVGNQFTQTISSSGIDAISNIRNKFTSQNSSKSTGDKNPELKASLANTVDSSRNSKFSRFSRGLSRAGTAISVAGPTIAGLVEQSVFGDKKRSEMSSNERMAQSFSSTGLSAVTTGVGIGAQAAGLPGALIGGAVGGLIALKSALDSASLSVEELKERQEEQKNKIIENISSAERYLVIQEEISKSTSPKDIKKNLVSLRAELSSIKDADFANKIKLAGTDINSLSAVVQEYSLKQKEATSVLNDAILVQKKYSFETLKSAGLLKIKEEGGTGQVAKFMKFASGGVNSMMQFLGIGGVKEKELSKIDLANKKTRETIYKENPNFFKSMSKVDRNAIVEISRVYSSELESSFGLGQFRTGDLTELLKQGGLQGTELESIVATLKEAATSGSLLGTALADGFVVAVSKFDEYQTSQDKQIQGLTDAAEAVANLNQQLKDFVNDLDYSFKDLSRQDEFQKNLRGVRRPNTMMIDESLYGKRSSLQTQYDFDIQDAESEKRTKELGISKTLLTTNIQDYYNLSDAQKTAYLALSKSFDLSKPEENLKKTENFIKDQFGTLDMQKATDKQKDYLQKISNIRKDIALTEKESADDLNIAAEKFKEALMAMELSRDFVFQFKAGFRDLATEGEMLIGTIGRQLPKMFADGLVDGIKAAIKESDNLGQALTGIASKFLDEISTMMMRSGIYQIMGSFAPSLAQGFGSASAIPVPSQKGGIIRAQSGMYISGTGTGDKYPAMLENGEYVLNRRAVMAMGGPAALDTLNFSAAPRFASGGAFSKEFNDISSMENNMTQMGLENDPYYNELNDAAKQKAAEDRAKKLADKQQKAAMIGSLVAAAATIAIGAGISNVAQNMQATKTQALSGKLTSGAELTKAESMSIRPLMNKGLLSPTGQYIGGTPNTGFKSIFSGPLQSGQLPFYQRGSMNPFAPKKAGKQTGGLIGSRLSDTIPGYMEGGLYDSPMVKRYGTGMQSGGSSISSAGNSNSTVNNNTSANNSFNFNTSVQRDGSLKMGSNTTSYEQQDVELSKNLNNKIYAAVGEVIRKEKQFGGSLAGARNS